VTIAADPRQFAGRDIAGWKGSLLSLTAAWLTVLLVYGEDVSDMATIAWTVSTYAYCLVALPVIAGLVWQRRDALSRVLPGPWWPGLVLAAGGATVWLLGDAAGVAVARHLGVVLMLQGSAVTLLGRSAGRILLFPLAYAVFLVPFGDFLVQPLQTITARTCIALLDAFAVPFWTDGVLIRIPNGYFEVAEACAGANFVLAMLALATLAAHLAFRTLWQGVAFVTFAVLVSIVANGVRAFATIYVGWWTSAEAAAGFDHIVYGWVFFAVIMAIVIAVVWRSLDLSRDPPNQGSSSKRDAPLAAVAPALAALLLVAPMWAQLSASRAATLSTPALPDVAGWSRGERGTPAWAPTYAGADAHLVRYYRSGEGQLVHLHLHAFARQEEGRELVGFGQGGRPEDGTWRWTSIGRPLPNARVERITGNGGVTREVATFYRIAGVTTGSATRVKLETLKARLLGRGTAAAAITVSSTDPMALRRFLHDLGRVEPIADRVLGSR
jgi:exosortase A